MFLIPTGKRATSTIRKKKLSSSSIFAVQPPINPNNLPELKNGYQVSNIVPYDFNETVPQKQHIDSKSSVDLFRPVCTPAPCTPPYLTTVLSGGAFYASMVNSGFPAIYGCSVTQVDAVRILDSATSFTVVYYIKDTIGTNAKNRYIQTLASGAYPASPYFRSLISAGSTNQFTSLSDGATVISITDGENYQTNGSIVAITFDGTTGTLKLHNYSSSYQSINGAWNPATVFYGINWLHGTFFAWDVVGSLNWDGILGDLYYFNGVLSDYLINGIAKWYANKFGLTLSNVWTNI